MADWFALSCKTKTYTDIGRSEKDSYIGKPRAMVPRLVFLRKGRYNKHIWRQKMKVRRQFVKYVSQNILGMVGVSLYILADTFFI